MRSSLGTVLLTALAALRPGLRSSRPPTRATRAGEFRQAHGAAVPLHRRRYPVAGLSCPAEEPCPSTWNWPLRSRLPGGFRGRNIHALDVTLYSVLLASEMRAHLAEAYERIRGASLDHIQFLDAELGWTSARRSPLFPGSLSAADHRWR